MPSYVETLTADHARLLATVQGLVGEQRAVVRRLMEETPVVQGVLDRAVLKLLFYSQHFGNAATETTLAQREAEEANTRMTELQRKLEKQIGVLQVYEARYAEIAAGRSPLEAPGAAAAVAPPVPGLT
ncbi:MAG: hypothetical protein HYX52_00660 [Chloroflexi bacterium]|nr:hypothetical protein [Chloroflexota bacterium]